MTDEKPKIEIEVKEQKPPKWIWDEVHRGFEIEDELTIYTYGNIIYDPRGTHKKIANSVIVHEMEHMKQQASTEGGPDRWWNKYLTDPQFRKVQEIQAYQKQYEHACTIYKDRNERARYLNILASFASSPMYKINLTHSEALKLIRNGQ